MSLFYTDLRRCCLSCFHLKVTWDTSDMGLDTVEDLLDARVRTMTGRDRIKRVRCAKELIHDNDGLPKEFVSTAALRACRLREGDCHAWEGEEDEHYNED